MVLSVIRRRKGRNLNGKKRGEGRGEGGREGDDAGGAFIIMLQKEPEIRRAHMDGTIVLEQ